MTEPESPSASGWRGQFVDGHSAAVHAVSLRVQDGALEVWSLADGRLLVRWERARLRVEAFGEGEVHIQAAGDPDALLTSDRGDTLAHLGGAISAGRGIPARPLRKALIFAAAAAAVAAGVYLNLRPISRAVAGRVPRSVEAQLGAGLENLLAPHYCSSAPADAVLTGLARRLAPDLEDAKVHVINLSVVNAFTLPGGTIALTRGLIGEAESADELAGVLAHELEHDHRRHVMSRVVRDSLVAAAWQVTVGDYTGLMALDPKTALDIASLRFSREDESEADRGGAERLDRAGISRQGMRAFFTRASKGGDHGIPEWLSSHPGSAARAQALGPGRDPPRPALSEAEWKALKQACDGKGEAVSLRELLLGR